MTGFDRAQAAYDTATPESYDDEPQYSDEDLHIMREDHLLEKAERDAEWYG